MNDVHSGSQCTTLNFYCAMSVTVQQYLRHPQALQCQASKVHGMLHGWVPCLQLHSCSTALTWIIRSYCKMHAELVCQHHINIF